MNDPLALRTAAYARLSPVARHAADTADALAGANGRALPRAEELVISLVLEGAEEPSFQAILRSLQVAEPTLVKELLALSRRTADHLAASGELLAEQHDRFWGEIAGAARGEIDCQGLLYSLLESAYLTESARLALAEHGLVKEILDLRPSRRRVKPSPLARLGETAAASMVDRPPLGRLLEAAELPELVGREAIVSAAAKRFARGQNVLLHGPQGVGKSLLARHAAVRSGRPTVELDWDELGEPEAADRATALAELTTWLAAHGAGLLLANLDDFRFEWALTLDPALPILGTSRVGRLPGSPDSARKFYARAVGEPDRSTVIAAVAAWQQTNGQLLLEPRDVPAAIELATTFFGDQGALPGTAIDLIKTATAGKRAGTIIDRAALEDAVVYLTRLPRAVIAVSERDRLNSLPARLGTRIIGQPAAIKAVADAITRRELSFNARTRPIGSFLFVGPTGVGKTELARALAAEFFGSETALLRFDMGEYQQEHEIARFVGSPPGYINSDKDGQLIAGLKKTPRVVLLLDEIEKASERVLDFLLGALDYGEITSGKGEKVSLLDSIIIMTSNLGGVDASEARRRRSLGFPSGALADRTSLSAAARHAAIERHFLSRPEFVNRLDAIIEFADLSAADLEQILALRLATYQVGCTFAGLTIELGPRLRERMIADAVASGLGARELVTRSFNTEVEDRVSAALLAGQYRRGAIFRIELDAKGVAGLTSLSAPTGRAH